MTTMTEIFSMVARSSSGSGSGSSFLSLIVGLVVLASFWQLFAEANEPGWAALVPLYNTYVLFKITFGNGLKMLWMFVPIVNIYFGIMVYVKLAKAFGKSGLYALGLMFLPFIFFPMLAFGKNSYHGPQY